MRTAAAGGPRRAESTAPAVEPAVNTELIDTLPIPAAELQIALPRFGLRETVWMPDRRCGAFPVKSSAPHRRNLPACRRRESRAARPAGPA